MIIPKNDHQQGILILSESEGFTLASKTLQRKDTPSTYVKKKKLTMCSFKEKSESGKKVSCP